MSGRPGTVVGSGCWIGSGLELSTAAAGFSLFSCARAKGAMAKTMKVIAIDRFRCFDKTAFIIDPPF
jgi:hypothetical protein